MSSSSTCSRPAVSRITTSSPSARAASSPFVAAATGSERSSAKTGSWICRPSCSSWSIAAGRWRSHATSPGRFALASEQEPELRGCRRLARALQPGEQDHGRRAAECEPRVAGAHQRGQLLVDDLHDLLARGEAPQDVLAERAFLDRGSEVARDLEVHVRLEQREPDLAHRLRDGVLVETAAATETAERRLELVQRVSNTARKCTSRLCMLSAAWTRPQEAPTLVRWTSRPRLDATCRPAR